ncbi:hypothetical protein [Streptomyces sp. NPDC056401]|uniref:hypothetical protein n=1 Tax=Streptomyces TaxID=1883 RepID=UPI0035E007A5
MNNQPQYLDQALTNVSNAWFNKDTDFIGSKLFPEVMVKKPTFKVAEYGKDGMRVPSSSARTGEAKAKRVNLTRGYNDVGPLTEHALSDIVTRDDYLLTDDPFEPESDVTENINQIMTLIDEKDVATMLRDTSIITQNTTLSGTSQWNDYANSNPFADITTGVKTGKFVNYNTASFSWESWLAIINHPDFLDRIKWSSLGVMTEADFLKLMAPYGITKLFIGKAKENTGKEGLADAVSTVWGGDFLLGYVTDRPGRKQVNGGYKFRLENGRQVTKEVKNNPPVTEIVNTDYYDHVLMNDECWYLIKNAVDVNA